MQNNNNNIIVIQNELHEYIINTYIFLNEFNKQVNRKIT